MLQVLILWVRFPVLTIQHPLLSLTHSPCPPTTVVRHMALAHPVSCRRLTLLILPRSLQLLRRLITQVSTLHSSVLQVLAVLISYRMAHKTSSARTTLAWMWMSTATIRLAVVLGRIWMISSQI